MAESALPPPADGYDEDFVAWTALQARALRARRLHELDFDNLAEEIESLGASDRRELTSRLEVLLVHLLKHHHQPEKRGKSWPLTIDEQRDRVADLLADSPSLRNHVPERVAVAYPRARRRASVETDLPPTPFPDVCPFRAEDILGDRPA